MPGDEVEVPLAAFAALRRRAVPRCVVVTVILAGLLASVVVAFRDGRAASVVFLLIPTALVLIVWLTRVVDLLVLQWNSRRARQRGFFARYVVSPESIRVVAGSGRVTTYELDRYLGWEVRRSLAGGPILRSVQRRPSTLRQALRGTPPRRFAVRLRSLEQAERGLSERLVTSVLERSGLPLLRLRRGVHALQFCAFPVALLLWWLCAEVMGVADEPIASPRGWLAMSPGIPLLIGCFWAIWWLEKRLFAPA